MLTLGHKILQIISNFHKLCHKKPEKVCSIVSEHYKKWRSKSDSNFQNDLSADSLDTVELVMALEEAFDIEIPDEAAEGIATVGDAVKFIEEKRLIKDANYRVVITGTGQLLQLVTTLMNIYSVFKKV